ncbi:M23 family metallopeptidase [Plantibacter flavus]|uniref:M23 family metallopeptidase n=1 Tax=Plantibacter flavus TaxID=150123 RepID=UPI003F1542F4
MADTTATTVPLTRRAARAAREKQEAHEIKSRRRQPWRPRRPRRSDLLRGLTAVLAATLVLPSVLTALAPADAGQSGPRQDPRPTAQPLIVAGTNGAQIERAGYSATSAEEVALLSASAPRQTAATFVNNLASEVQWPFVTGVPITDDFGPRSAPCSGCSTFHKGLDLAPGAGTDVRAIAAGVVRVAQESDSGLGVHVVIDHLVGGDSVSSVSAHLQFGSLRVAPGDVVSVGQVIGSVGSTGQSTGPHLHLEILDGGTTPIDPYAWLLARVTV